MPPRDALRLVPFARTLGLSVVRDGPDEVVLRFAWDPSLCTGGGVLHGGALMAAADTAGAVCAVRNLPPGAAGTVTVESKTNFLRPVAGGHVEVTARPLHVGRTLIVVESDLTDDGRRLVARVTQSQLVLGGPSPRPTRT